MESDRVFHSPPRPRSPGGEWRRVGVELEFAGLTPEQAGEVVTALFGGQWRPESPFVGRVVGTRLGDVPVVLDSSLLKERRYEKGLRMLGMSDQAGDALARGLAAVAGLVAPCEIAAPPLPLPDLPLLEELRQGLRQAGALGSGASLLYAFGLHFNPEVPDREVRGWLNVLRAYLLLHEWLVETGRVDFTRRALPYIRSFPEQYRRLAADPAYAPDLDVLVADYLRFSPTRNRPLDMLPLFCLTHEPVVRAALRGNEPVKPRPTFHFRLPNCRVDEPDWTVAEEWNRWVVVERLAEDEERLTAMSREFLKTDADAWPQRIPAWIEP